ncbi:PhlD [Streptomyces sp. NPDC058299]|uniref:PhlD n=1 Tax=Streptomyces sp. NPDC058299 TaxID=3346435 RepID=UPI0036ED18CF
MPAHIGRPVITLAPHLVTTEDLIDRIATTYRDPDFPSRPRPSFGVWKRLILNTGVRQRYWSRPLQEATTPSSVGHRAQVAFGDALDLAESAARQALDAAGLHPGDIDAIVTSHTTSWTVPGLDIHLIERLGLNPTVARMPLATLACSGGAHALARALLHTDARHGDRVLVVVAETLSTIYHQSEDTPQSMMYRALFGDSAGACIVTGIDGRDYPDPGFVISDPFELAMPNSRDRYWGSIDGHGLHFESTKAASTAAADALPYMTDWLGERPVDWAVVHPGGPRIIDDVVAGVGLDPHKDGRHSHTSLAENGNLGGVAVLDVLRRAHDDPPAPGAPGLLAAFGPGFTVAGVYGNWA